MYMCGTMNDISSQALTLIDRGGSQSDLRRHNERVVLSALDRHPGLFNAELSRRTGLAAQTISVILRALEQQGLIARGAVLRGRRGQPATPLYLKPEGGYGLGAALCWRRVFVGMSDLSGTILAEENKRHAVLEFDATLDTIAGIVDRFAATLPANKRARIAGLGLAVPGAVDRYLTTLQAPAQSVRPWAERDFCAELSKAIGLPVWQAGFGVAASEAEARQGAQPQGEDFAYFYLGTMLMGGIVSGGAGISAAKNPGNMLGAMLVPGPDGSSVRADDIASERGLLAVLAKGGVTEAGTVGQDWDWHAFAPLVEEWLDAATAALSHVIVNTTYAFDVGRVVVDGLLPRDVIGALVERLGPMLESLPVVGQLPTIAQGELGPRAAMIGATRLPLHQRFFNIDNAS